VSKFVEIRSYKLKPGSGLEYHRLMSEAALPLLAAQRVDVVAYGQSRHDPDAYFLIRAFDSLEHRDSAEEDFYGSAAWRQGPREAVLALIETYTEFVVELDEPTVNGLRASVRG
jgi:NIPSNAP protein